MSIALFALLYFGLSLPAVWLVGGVCGFNQLEKDYED